MVRMISRRPLHLALLCSLSLPACGGSTAEPADPSDAQREGAEASRPESSEGGEPAEGEASEAAAEAEKQPGLPQECAGKGEVCTPPGKFVRWHCEDPSPTVALALFASGTPWTRGYLTRKTQAWNASGGASASGWLAFDEEVLILRHRKARKGGMQVSGAGGGYDAMRWDGSCVTLSGEELTTRTPPSAKYAKVTWRWLEDPLQEALREDAKVNEAYLERRKHCKGATMGAVTAKCERWDGKLSDRIVKYVRGGGRVPTPQKLPDSGG